MTANLYEWALQRRRNWKEEGRQEALLEALQEAQQAEQELRKEIRERFLREAFVREEFRREQIDKVLAADTLTPEEKVYVIGILNAV